MLTGCGRRRQAIGTLGICLGLLAARFTSRLRAAVSAENESARAIHQNVTTEELQVDSSSSLRKTRRQQRLGVFHGEVHDAFDQMHETAKLPPHIFRPMEEILSYGVTLRDEANFMPRSGRIAVKNIFPGLFGMDSDFTQQYMAKQKGLAVEHEAESLLGAEWSAVSTMKCKISIPMSGTFPMSEWKRMVLVRNKTMISLVVQAVSNVRVGKIVGDIKTETLYRFSEPAHGGGPVRFQTDAVAPVGPMKGVVMQNYVKAATDFAETARNVL